MARKRLGENMAGKSGHLPGVAKYVGQNKDHEISIELLRYDSGNCVYKSIDTACPDIIDQDKTEGQISWLNINGVHDVNLLEKIGKRFKLHPLVIEDIAHTNQRPKMELHVDYIYITLKMLQWDTETNETTIEQVSLILGKDYVISFQQHTGDVFEQIRTRIRSGQGRIRIFGADYLCYSLIDAIVDEYFTILEHRGELIEALEDEVMEYPTPQTLKQLYKLKREGLFMRKSIWPIREIASQFERLEQDRISAETLPYFRDIYDHSIRVIETMEAMRDMLSGLRDTYLSIQSNRMNEVMKVLTIISTIFIPLTFIAGIYGMNFKYMPETEFRWAYPVVWVVMLIMAGIMLKFFRSKKWL